MAFRLLAVVLGLALAGCASGPRRAPSDVLPDPALSAAAQALLCRVEPHCGGVLLYVLDRSQAQAQMFPDGRLLLNLGLLLETRSEAEIAFVLAHETAHRRLRHRRAGSASARAQLEIDADAEAVRTLRSIGLADNAGLHLLLRLLAHADHEVVAEPALQGPASGAGEEARLQIVGRIAALQELLDAAPEGAPVSAPASAEDARWRALLAPYRLSAESPASLPERRSPVDP